MKTEIKLTVTNQEGRSFAPFFRVKLDKQRKPYIVIENQKYYITDAKFPREVLIDSGRTKLFIDIKEGLSELKVIVENAAQ